MDVKRGTSLEMMEWESESRILFKVEKKDLQNERLGAKVVTKCTKKAKKKSRVNKGFRACNASSQIAVRS